MPIIRALQVRSMALETYTLRDCRDGTMYALAAKLLVGRKPRMGFFVAQKSPTGGSMRKRKWAIGPIFVL